jgi:chromosome segregation ATPase
VVGVSDREPVRVLVDADVKQKLKRDLEHGELSERLREEANRIAYGSETAERERVQRELVELREERRDLNDEISSLQHERDEVERKIERAEHRLSELEDKAGEYDGVLAMLEEDLSEGARVFHGTEKVKRAAEIGNCDPEDVIADLQERNPNVPDLAFEKPDPNEHPNWRHATGTAVTNAQP